MQEIPEQQDVVEQVEMDLVTQEAQDPVVEVVVEEEENILQENQDRQEMEEEGDQVVEDPVEEEEKREKVVLQEEMAVQEMLVVLGEMAMLLMEQEVRGNLDQMGQEQEEAVLDLPVTEEI